jgi:integrase/recombinase XerD
MTAARRESRHRHGPVRSGKNHLRPARTTFPAPSGRRDRALLALALHTGQRQSELIGLTRQDVHLATGAHVSCHGKGRKERITPLSPAMVAILRAWLAERGGHRADPLFPTRRGTPLSRDALERLVTKYTHKATQPCPSLNGKKVTPHVLRHTAAMRLLHAGVDITVIALWLGHESTETTQIYIAADLALKEQALSKTRPLDTSPGRFKPTDQLLAFLEGL